MKSFAASVLVLFVLSGGSRADDPDPKKIAEGELTHDFGTVLPNDEPVHHFKITNPYKAPLTIKTVRVSAASCATAKASQLCLNPGDTVDIEVRMNPNRFIGKKVVMVFVAIEGNGGGYCEVLLTVSATR